MPYSEPVQVMSDVLEICYDDDSAASFIPSMSNTSDIVGMAAELLAKDQTTTSDYQVK